MKPIIGITCGEIRNKLVTWQPVAHGQSRTYVNAVIDAGGVPLLLPITDNPEVMRPLYDILDGLLMSGGNDVDPSLFGQKPSEHTKDFSKLRDDSERQLLAWALDDAMPVLAICRGMQLINVMRGGTLHQHIADEVPDALDHEVSTKAQDLQHLAHKLQIKPGSKLAEILDAESILANSHHHQAINKPGKGIIPTAWTADGIIEAIELAEYPYFIGMQSHPESLYDVAEKRYRHLFESLIEAAKSGALLQPSLAQ